MSDKESDRESNKEPWKAYEDRRNSNDTRHSRLTDEDESGEDRRSKRSEVHSAKSRDSEKMREEVMERSRKQSRQSALSEILQVAQGTINRDVHSKAFAIKSEDEEDGKVSPDEDTHSRDRSTVRRGKKRGKWSGKLDFLLSCLGYAVGLGNVWRFPYLCYKFGGGAFLIAYLIMLLFIGIPCFFLELALGQYSAMGPTVMYANISPIFAGVGFATFFASAVVAIYYNMLIAWTIYYLIASLTSGPLPWETCQNQFNICFSVDDYKKCTQFREDNEDPSIGAIFYHRGQCISDGSSIAQIKDNISYFYGCRKPNVILSGEASDYCQEVLRTEYEPGVYINQDTCVKANRQNEFGEPFDMPHGIRNTAAQEYFTKDVLNESSGIDEWGVPQWKLVLCLLGAWLVVFLCLINGVNSSGKVVYFTATFPYIILIILFVRAVLLPGAWEGIKFYIIPEWSRLWDIRIWEAAAVQIFFSLGVGSGGLITMSSYNNFDGNVLRDALIVSIGNCCTSVFAGFAIFSVLGFLATELGVQVSSVVNSGTGLAFVAYPDLVTRLPIAPLWSVLFFIMLFTLGLDSQFTFVETLVTGILDLKPSWRRRKWIVVLVISVLGFLLGLPLTTRAGGYLVDLLDYYGAGWAFLFIALMELIIVSYVYGLRRFFRDLEEMFDFKPNLWMQGHMAVMFSTVSPLIILFILIYSWVVHEPLTRDEYVYPDWANILGWVIALIPIVAVPIIGLVVMGYRFCKRDQSYSVKKVWKSKKQTNEVLDEEDSDDEVQAAHNTSIVDSIDETSSSDERDANENNATERAEITNAEETARRPEVNAEETARRPEVNAEETAETHAERVTGDETPNAHKASAVPPEMATAEGEMKMEEEPEDKQLRSAKSLMGHFSRHKDKLCTKAQNIMDARASGYEEDLEEVNSLEGVRLSMTEAANKAME
eukprot:maker-scaffold282_size228295-snap-gene-0.14 protein:Tk05521 transcript:maker-scaffold282_size228295-snap-gene-0.14-mRNA-1 annotation:"sodium- and chloride-dependent glycine transporter 2-like"